MAPQPPGRGEADSPARSGEDAGAVGTDDATGYKSRGGLGRIWRALGYSRAGFASALRHEAAFRQELALGVPMLLLAPWLAPTALQALALAAVVLLVWIVELVNSAIEALADSVSVELRPLLGRAKDLGSAAVLLSLLLAGLTWVVVLGVRWFG
ncbi:MAG: diacylglycerol kinase [Rubrivivax sp.]|nr:diacylglycerol kinase [Rubrivivax sp.]